MKNDFEKRIDDLQKQINLLKGTKNEETLTAQQRADKKYKSKLQSVNLRFRPQDNVLWDFLESKENKTQYIKTLILKDMGYKNWSHYKGLTPGKEYDKLWEKQMLMQQFKSKLLDIETWDEFNNFIENNKLNNWEWEQIEKLFYIDNSNSELAGIAFDFGALPFYAWSKQAIKCKINNIFNISHWTINVDWDKYTEEELRKKILKKSPIGDSKNTLNSHIEFYKIDEDAAIKELGIRCE